VVSLSRPPGQDERRAPPLTLDTRTDARDRHAPPRPARRILVPYPERRYRGGVGGEPVPTLPPALTAPRRNSVAARPTTRRWRSPVSWGGRPPCHPTRSIAIWARRDNSDWRCLVSDLSEDAKRNIEENRATWGEEDAWRGNFRYGHDWSDQLHCRNVAEKYLHPFLPGGELDIVEIAPGAGRFTAELIRLARSMVLVDLNQACIDLCRERFRYYERIQFLVNDGISLEAVADESADLIASLDSFVHIEREVVEHYVLQFPRILRSGGIAWIHHSARGKHSAGWRSNMTSELMARYAETSGLLVKAQIFRQLEHQPVVLYKDCISVLTKL
jgi:hypothetical protein